MPGLVLVLSLAGLTPGPFLRKTVIVPTEHAWLAPSALLLDVDLDGSDAGALDELGRTLGRGLGAGSVHLGIEGVPGSPFVSNFLHAHEIPRITNIDPETLAGNLMLQLRVELD